MSSTSLPGRRGPFHPHTREENLDRLARDTFDVCVIGGGITGAGVALDCAARGLAVALVEKGDFGSGSSSRSSRMVHGGLRYLGTGDVALCRACIRERGLLHRLAPHLVRPTLFVYALMGQRSRSTLRLGLTIQDALGGARGFRLHHRVRDGELSTLAPLLRADRLDGAWTYVDATTDDARLVLGVVAASHAFGAVVANHVQAEGVECSGRLVKAVDAIDVIEQRSFTVRARAIVNATGVWADDLSGLDRGRGLSVTPSKGVHLVIPAERLPLAGACVFPAVDGREIVAVRDGNVVFFGTTDTEYRGAFDVAAVEPADVEYLLASVNAAFDVALLPADVVAAWAGLRPLIGDPTKSVSERSRSHRIVVSPSGVISVTGGKLTLYRAMAEETGDAVCELLGVRRRSSTRWIPLDRGPSPDGDLRRIAVDAAWTGLDDGSVRHLVATYGTHARGVLDLIAEDPELAHPLVEGCQALAAEAVWAVRHEMAMTLDDVLTRRTRLASRDREAGLHPLAVRSTASELGWSVDQELREIDVFRRSVARERGPSVAPPSRPSWTSGRSSTR